MNNEAFKTNTSPKLGEGLLKLPLLTVNSNGGTAIQISGAPFKPVLLTAEEEYHYFQYGRMASNAAANPTIAFAPSVESLLVLQKIYQEPINQLISPEEATLFDPRDEEFKIFFLEEFEKDSSEFDRVLIWSLLHNNSQFLGELLSIAFGEGLNPIFAKMISRKVGNNPKSEFAMLWNLVSANYANTHDQEMQKWADNLRNDKGVDYANYFGNVHLRRGEYFWSEKFAEICEPLILNDDEVDEIKQSPNLLQSKDQLIGEINRRHPKFKLIAIKEDSLLYHSTSALAITLSPNNRRLMVSFIPRPGQEIIFEGNSIGKPFSTFIEVDLDDMEIRGLPVYAEGNEDKVLMIILKELGLIEELPLLKKDLDGEHSVDDEVEVATTSYIPFRRKIPDLEPERKVEVINDLEELDKKRIQEVLGFDISDSELEQIQDRLQRFREGKSFIKYLSHFEGNIVRIRTGIRGSRRIVLKQDPKTKKWNLTSMDLRDKVYKKLA